MADFISKFHPLGCGRSGDARRCYAAARAASQFLDGSVQFTLDGQDMLPSESFSVDSLLSPDEFLRRVQADADDWRETRLSEPARAAGMYGFAFTPDGRAFRLRAKMST